MPCSLVATSVVGASGCKAICLSNFRPVPRLCLMVYPSRCTPRFWRVFGHSAGSTAFVKASAFWSLVPTRLSSTSSRSNCSFTEARLTRWTRLRSLSFMEYPAVTTFAQAVLSLRSLNNTGRPSVAEYNSTNGNPSSKSTYDSATVSVSVVLRHVAVCFFDSRANGNDVCGPDNCSHPPVVLLYEYVHRLRSSLRLRKVQNKHFLRYITHTTKQHSDLGALKVAHGTVQVCITGLRPGLYRGRQPSDNSQQVGASKACQQVSSKCCWQKLPERHAHLLQRIPC